jgi:succinate dehydrogenase / fumarate reductase membrane anchor subunit
MVELRKSGMWPWFLQRITALFLVFGLFVHFWVLHYWIERPVTFDKVVERLSTTGWILFDSLLLIACIFHAFNGLYSILVDFNVSLKTKKSMFYILTVAGIILSIFGIVVLLPPS